MKSTGQSCALADATASSIHAATSTAVTHMSDGVFGTYVQRTCVGQFSKTVQESRWAMRSALRASLDARASMAPSDEYARLLMPVVRFWKQCLGAGISADCIWPCRDAAFAVLRRIELSACYAEQHNGRPAYADMWTSDSSSSSSNQPYKMTCEAYTRQRCHPC